MQDTPQNRYRKKNLWTLSTTFNRATEPQLIEQVQSQDNKQGYIKALIRADIAKSQKGDQKMIKYRGYMIDRDDLGRMYIYNTKSPYSIDSDHIIVRAANYKDAKKIVDARIASGQDVRDCTYL